MNDIEKYQRLCEELNAPDAPDDGIDWPSGAIIWPPQPKEIDLSPDKMTLKATDELLTFKPILAYVCDDQMAIIRHRFATLFPQVPFNSQALKNALVAECGQSMATVDGLLLSEVAELLEGIQEQRTGSRQPEPENEPEEAKETNSEWENALEALAPQQRPIARHIYRHGPVSADCLAGFVNSENPREAVRKAVADINRRWRQSGYAFKIVRDDRRSPMYYEIKRIGEQNGETFR